MKRKVTRRIQRHSPSSPSPATSLNQSQTGTEFSIETVGGTLREAWPPCPGSPASRQNGGDSFVVFPQSNTGLDKGVTSDLGSKISKRAGTRKGAKVQFRYSSVEHSQRYASQKPKTRSLLQNTHTLSKPNLVRKKSPRPLKWR